MSLGLQNPQKGSDCQMQCRKAEKKKTKIKDKGIIQPTLTCSKTTIETLEQGVKYV